jgi:hypothetical protein
MSTESLAWVPSLLQQQRWSGGAGDSSGGTVGVEEESAWAPDYSGHWQREFRVTHTEGGGGGRSRLLQLDGRSSTPDCSRCCPHAQGTTLPTWVPPSPSAAGNGAGPGGTGGGGDYGTLRSALSSPRSTELLARVLWAHHNATSPQEGGSSLLAESRSRGRGGGRGALSAGIRELAVHWADAVYEQRSPYGRLSAAWTAAQRGPPPHCSCSCGGAEEREGITPAPTVARASWLIDLVAGVLDASDEGSLPRQLQASAEPGMMIGGPTSPAAAADDDDDNTTALTEPGARAVFSLLEEEEEGMSAGEGRGGKERGQRERGALPSSLRSGAQAVPATGEETDAEPASYAGSSIVREGSSSSSSRGAASMVRMTRRSQVIREGGYGASPPHECR